jgi:hypothetical protein
MQYYTHRKRMRLAGNGTKERTMNFTTRELENFCDTCVRRGNYYMAAVSCVALGAGYEWKYLTLSVEQAAAVQSLDGGTAMAVVSEYAWQLMG